jgi:hypothetical protein
MVIGFREAGSARPPGGAVGSSIADARAEQRYVSSITVERRSADDVGIREIFISVDGEQIAILGPGDLITHEIPAGPHRIRAHNTLFWKTHDVVLQPGEHARFRAVNRAGWGSYGLLMVLGASPLYLTFERIG